MAQTFTSPSGATYVWDKPTPPTQEDIDAIVAHDADVNGARKAAPSPEMRVGGAGGSWEDSNAPMGAGAFRNGVNTSMEFGGDVGPYPGPQNLAEAKTIADAGQKATAAFARIAPVAAAAPFTGGMSMLPYVATMGTAGLVGEFAGSGVEGKLPTPGESARAFITAGSPVPKIVAGGNAAINAFRGAAATALTVGAGTYAKEAVDQSTLAPFDSFKDAFKDATVPAIISAATMGIAGKLGSMAKLQAEADAGKAAMADLGATNPTLGDVLPKKYGALQASVAQTTPEIANKIAAARSPIAKSFYAQIGDVPMNEDIATQLTPIIQKMDKADMAYTVASDRLAKASAALEKADSNAMLTPAQRAKIHTEAASEQMAALSAQAEAQIQQQILADTVGTQTGHAEGLKNVVRTLFGVRSEGAAALLKQTGIDPNAAVFSKNTLIEAAKQGLGADADTIAGRSIISTLNGIGNKTGKDAAAARAAAFNAKMRDAADRGVTLTPEEGRAIFTAPKGQLYDPKRGFVEAAPTPADIPKDTSYLSLEEFRNLRNSISDGFVAALGGNNTSNAERLASKAYAAMGESQVGQVAQVYGPDAAEGYQRFQKFWRDTSQLRDSDFGRALLRGEIADDSVAKMADNLAAGKVDEIKNFKNFVDLLRPQNEAVAKNAMAAMGSAVRNSMVQKASDAAGNVDYRALGQLVQKTVSKTDFPFPLETFRLGNKETIAGWNKALQEFKPSDLTKENIRSVMESPQIQAALAVGGKDIGPRIKTMMAEKAFGKRVTDAAAMKEAGMTAQARDALAEAASFAKQAGIDVNTAQAAMLAAENNPLTSVFRGKGGYSLTNEADNMGSANSITGLVDGMKRSEGKQFINALRGQQPNLADMVERRLLANEFASFSNSETRVPGEIRGIDQQKVRQYFEPQPNNLDSRVGKLTAILGPEKMAAFKKFATGIANLNDAQRQALIDAKVTHSGVEAAGATRMLSTGSTQSGRSLMNVIKLAADSYNRKRFNLLSAMILDDGVMNAMSRNSGNVGEALSSIPAQKAYLLMFDRRLADELGDKKKP